jgi:hypothetical protein
MDSSGTQAGIVKPTTSHEDTASIIRKELPLGNPVMANQDQDKQEEGRVREQPEEQQGEGEVLKTHEIPDGYQATIDNSAPARCVEQQPEPAQEPELEPEQDVPAKLPRRRRNANSQPENGTEEAEPQERRRRHRRRKEETFANGGAYDKETQAGQMTQMSDGTQNITPGSQAGLFGQQGQIMQQHADRSGGKQPLRLRLDLNLEVDIELRARIHGDLTLALLYVTLLPVPPMSSVRSSLQQTLQSVYFSF